MPSPAGDLPPIAARRVALQRLLSEIEPLKARVERREVGTLDPLAIHRFGVSTQLLADDRSSPKGRWSAATHLFLNAVRGWGPGPAANALRTDGTEGHSVGLQPAPGIRLMGAGQKLDLLADPADDAVITCEVTLASVDLKEGTSGPLALVRWRNRYVDQHGTVIAECLETMIAR